MKLKKYLEYLDKLIEENPEALNCDIIFAKDDQGDTYQKSDFIPSLCFVEDLSVHEINHAYFYQEDFKDQKPHAVCIN